MIHPALASDAPAVAGIYNHYVQHSSVTFEEALVTDAEMARRIDDVSATLPWLVAEEDGSVIGYAYAGKWKARSAYRHSVEASIYLAPGATGRGLGSHLLGALLDELRRREVHVVIGGAALPNPASAALLESHGFKPIGRFNEIG